MSFKSKMKKLITKPGQSVEDLQTTFNQVMFRLGNAQYKKHLIAQEGGKISKLPKAQPTTPSQPLPEAK
jgi:hypothetical protein